MKVLFIYPNHKGMNMLPPAIGLLSACLKREGHTVQLFDTTHYNSVILHLVGLNLLHKFEKQEFGAFYFIYTKELSCLPATTVADFTVCTRGHL